MPSFDVAISDWPKSSKAARRLQPTVIKQSTTSQPTFGAAAAAAQVNTTPNPAAAAATNELPDSDNVLSTEIQADQILKENFHALNWSIKVTQKPTDFKADDKMLAILKARRDSQQSQTATSATSRFFGARNPPPGKATIEEIEEYLRMRTVIRSENERREFDSSSPIAQRLSPDVLAALRVCINAPDLVIEGSIGDTTRTESSKWVD
ncbi:hypothetical protein HK100_002640 [Physocladia obscura]|uniref:Uncharacterized protein n=1 Tax=Physocladia obscura TaxID=109957 RepID=A0AAD5T136_9FUNG|nr:hypothetical protein HK100_002640 [Physocladia obscura]